MVCFLFDVLSNNIFVPVSPDLVIHPLPLSVEGPGLSFTKKKPWLGFYHVPVIVLGTHSCANSVLLPLPQGQSSKSRYWGCSPLPCPGSSLPRAGTSAEAGGFRWCPPGLTLPVCNRSTLQSLVQMLWLLDRTLAPLALLLPPWLRTKSLFSDKITHSQLIDVNQGSGGGTPIPIAGPPCVRSLLKWVLFPPRHSLPSLTTTWTRQPFLRPPVLYLPLPIPTAPEPQNQASFFVAVI